MMIFMEKTGLRGVSILPENKRLRKGKNKEITQNSPLKLVNMSGIIYFRI